MSHVIPQRSGLGPIHEKVIDSRVALEEVGDNIHIQMNPNHIQRGSKGGEPLDQLG